MRIVTKEQLAQGYWRLEGEVPFHYAYLVIAKRPDGTFLVAEPSEPPVPKGA